MANISSQYLPGVSYRQWLQDRAEHGSSDEIKRNAQRLLDTVGDDGRIDEKYRHQNYYSIGNDGTRRIPYAPGNQQGNWGVYYHNWDGLNAINDQMKAAYNSSNVQYKWKHQQAPNSNTTTSSISTSNPYAAQQARDNALKIADIDERLRLMPNQLNRINQAEQNRYANIEDSFNRANAGLDSHWKQTQEDYNTARNQRLANRRRQISVSDDDFKKQNDAYARYFSRTGSGSSSTALYSVPALLARATQKIRNDIETNNAEQANEQDTNFNRANLEYKREKDNILNLRARQRKETKQDFDTKRSGYWDARSGLEREKANYQNRSVADIMAAGRDASDKANRYADEAVRAGNLTEDIKFKPINFQNVAPKDFNYDPTKTKVVEDKEEDSDSLYRKYFRDKEEEKKKKGWITGVGV